MFGEAPQYRFFNVLTINLKVDSWTIPSQPVSVYGGVYHTSPSGSLSIIEGFLVHLEYSLY